MQTDDIFRCFRRLIERRNLGSCFGSPMIKLPVRGFGVTCLIGMFIVLQFTFPRVVFASDDVFRDKFIAFAASTRYPSGFSLASSLCEAVNRERSSSLIRCLRIATTGDEFNVKAVLNRAMTMSLTNSVVAHKEFVHSDAVSEGGKLRVVFRLDYVPLLVMVRKDLHLSKFEQLIGHRIDIGQNERFAKEVLQNLIRDFGLGEKTRELVSELSSQQAANDFCDGKVDALLHFQTNASSFYVDLVQRCGGTLLAVPVSVVEPILVRYPQLAIREVPTQGGIKALCYQNLVVTHADVSAESVRRYVASVMRAWPSIRLTLPERTMLETDALFKSDISIPFHQGVYDYLTLEPGAK